MPLDGRRARFVGFGMSTYQHGGAGQQFEQLPDARNNIESLGDLLRSLHFDVREHHDLTNANYIAALKEAFAPPDDGALDALVVLWSGHGETPAETFLRLVLADSEPDQPLGLSAEILASLALRCEARQTLILFDTCFSGNTARVTNAITKLRDEFGETDSYVGVLASAHSWQEATGAGTLAPIVSRLLSDGPADSQLRIRFHTLNQGVRGDDLIEAVKREWPSGLDHRPLSWETGLQEVMFPNPLFVPRAPNALDARLLMLAEGRSTAEEGNFFSGRVTPLTQIVDWFGTATPGIGIITGRSGTGKSALAARIASLANGKARAAIDPATVPDGTDPGEGSVHAFVPVAGQSEQQIVEALDRQLSASGILPPMATPRNRYELLGGLKRVASDSTPRVILDGLDEVADAVFPLLTNLVEPLATCVQLLIATRDIASESGGLISSALPTLLIDLSSAESRAETQSDIAAFVGRRLADTSATRGDIDLVTERIFAELAPGEGPFLIARLVTTQLRSTPKAFLQDGWAEQLAFRVEDILINRLRGLTGTAPGGTQAGDAAQELLTALAFAHADGVPDIEWAVMASAVAQKTYSQNDVHWAIAELPEFIMSAATDGRAVYRLSYQRLIRHLLTDLANDDDAGVDTPLRIAEALGKQYERVLDTQGEGGVQPHYLHEQFWLHAVDAGEPGLDLFEKLRHRRGDEPHDLRPDLARGWWALSARQGEAGFAREAVASSERATTLLIEVGESDPSVAPDLAMALDAHSQSLLAVGDVKEATQAANTSEILLRQIASSDDTYRPQLGHALRNRALILSEAGDPYTAKQLASESLGIFRSLLQNNDAYASDVATGLHQMAVVHAALEEHKSALGFSEDAVTTWQEIAGKDPSQLRFLGRAFDLLGNRLGSVRSYEAAHAATIEALRIFHACLSPNPIHQADLAQGLTNLSIRLSDLRQWNDALEPGDAAVEILRKLVIDNPAYQTELAGALINLGNRYNEDQNFGKAATCHEEAVAILRDQDNVAGTQRDLVLAANNLATSYLQGDQFWQAVDSAEYAVAKARELASIDARHLGELGRALNNLSNCYDGIGDDKAAIRSARESVEIRRAQLELDPRAREELGQSLNNLSLRLASGDSAEALAVADETVTVFEGLDPSARRDELLAHAHRNLANRFAVAEQVPNAIYHLELTVELYERLAPGSSYFAAQTGMSLSLLAGHYENVGQLDEAVRAAERALGYLQSASSGSLQDTVNVAIAQQTLALLLRKQGQHEHSTAVGQDAVQLWFSIASSQPSTMESLVTAVYELQITNPELGENEWVQAWSDVEAALPGAATYQFQALRAQYIPNAQEAVAVLGAAMAAAPPEELSIMRQCARQARANLGEPFDQAWTEHAGSIPKWLTISLATVEMLDGWFTARSLPAEVAYARENQDALLEPEFEVALRLLAEENPQHADMIHDRADLIERAHAAGEAGFEAAYAPRLTAETMRQFLTTPASNRFRFLARERDTLISSLAFDYLRQLPGPPGDVFDFALSVALLNLAGADADEDASDALVSVESRQEYVEKLLADAPHLLEAWADVQRAFSDSVSLQATAFATAAFSLAIEGDESNAAAAARHVQSLDQSTALWAVRAIGSSADSHGQVLSPLLVPLVTPSAGST